jgi:hypothetical protein
MTTTKPYGTPHHPTLAVLDALLPGIVGEIILRGWKPLTKMRKEWNTDAFAGTIRNNLGHHFTSVVARRTQLESPLGGGVRCWNLARGTCSSTPDSSLPGTHFSLGSR